MNTVLNFMDKIYSDSSTLSIIYIVGASLLFVFIVLLIFSLRKPNEKKSEKILDEPIIDKKEELNSEKTEVSKIEEKVEIENVLEKENVVDNSSTEKKDLSSILDNVEIKEETKQDIIEEEKALEIPNLSSDIPDVDEFVDSIVKKTYEKNEQFSSVFVGENTSTIKLDKVLDKMNVEEDIKNDIVPDDEKSIKNETIAEEDNNVKEEINNIETSSKLDALKKSLEDKKVEVNDKQNDLKAKLEGLKNNKEIKEQKINLNDLANKLKKD